MKGYCTRKTKVCKETCYWLLIINLNCRVCNNYTTVGDTQVYSTLHQRIDIDHMVVICFALLTVCCSINEWVVILSHYCSTNLSKLKGYVLFTNTIKYAPTLCGLNSEWSLTNTVTLYSKWPVQYSHACSASSECSL